MAFVQVIEFRTSRIEDMRVLGDEWESSAAGQGTARRRVMCADREDPGRFFNLVWFDDYESAMANSELPVTQEFSQRRMALGDGPPTFHNLEVIEDRTLNPS